jgi:hypothetical protein
MMCFDYLLRGNGPAAMVRDFAASLYALAIRLKYPGWRAGTTRSPAEHHLCGTRIERINLELIVGILRFHSFGTMISELLAVAVPIPEVLRRSVQAHESCTSGGQAACRQVSENDQQDAGCQYGQEHDGLIQVAWRLAR